MNSANIITIVVAVFISITAPLILVLINQRSQIRFREEDWKRQDEVALKASDAAADLLRGQREVAAQAAEAARLLQDKQNETAAAAERARIDLAESQKVIADQAAQAASLLLANNELVAQTSAGIATQLGVIHGLVNSDMTKAMQAEYNATEALLVIQEELIDIKRAAGQEPTETILAAVATTRAKLHELAASLEDRARAQDRVNNIEKSSGGESGA